MPMPQLLLYYKYVGTEIQDIPGMEERNGPKLSIEQARKDYLKEVENGAKDSRDLWGDSSA